MTQGKDIIYVNGDSFAQGCDIADHLYPNFKKNYSLNELLSIPFKQAIENQRSLIHTRTQYQINNPGSNLEFLEYERQHRWSSKLEQILNRPVVNISSHGGSSMYAIAYRTIADVIALQNDGYNITDVIIQITSGGRHSIFKNTDLHEEPSGTRHHRHGKYNILSTNLTRANNEKYQGLAEQLAIHEHIDFNEYRALHDLLMLKSALISLTGARIIFVDSVFYRKTLGKDVFFKFENCQLGNNNHVLKFKKQLDNDIELSMLECIDPDEPDTMTVGMHFTAKVHELFANKIAERYFK